MGDGMYKATFLLLLLVTSGCAAMIEDMLTLVSSEQRTFPSTIESGYNSAVLQISLRNTGAHLYTNVTLNASFSQPFTAVNGSYTIAQIAPGEKRTATLVFDVGYGTGTYTVPIWVTYYDATAEGSTKVYREAYIGVSTTPRLEIQRIETKPEKISVGSKFTVNVTIANTGKVVAAGIQANISINNSYATFSTPVPVYIPSVLPGKQVSVAFEGRISPFSPTGGFEGRVALSFENGTVSSDFILPVEGKSDFDIALNSSKIKIGTDDTLTFVIRNLGQAEFSDVTVQAKSSTAIFADSQVFVGDISAGESKEVSLKTFVDRSTNAGVYSITIYLNSSQGNRKEDLNLNLYGTPVMRFAGVTTDETPVVDRKVSLSIQLENIGTEDARALTVRLRDAPVTGNTESSVGTIEIDDTGSAVFDVTFTKAGTFEIPAEISYLDNRGDSHNITLAASIYVENAPFNLSPFIALFIIVAVAAYFFHRKRDRRAKIAKI